jgi:hypothetical protein
MNPTEARAIVNELYAKALTVNAQSTPTAVLERILADDFESINSQERKPKGALVKQIASGSPKGPFMGLALDGARSFRIDTSDIHELVNGRIARVHHLEDWATAMRQLGNK